MVNLGKKSLFSLFFSVTICAMAQAATSQTAVTFSDSSKTITVQQASPTFTIYLQSNRTTGYSWFIKKIDSHVLKLESHTYIAPQQAMPGAGGYEEWIFKVKPHAFKAPVSTTVKMIYARPWEKTAAKDITFKIAIQP